MAKPSRAMRAPKDETVCAAQSRRKPACRHSAPVGNEIRTEIPHQKNEHANAHPCFGADSEPQPSRLRRKGLGDRESLHGTACSAGGPGFEGWDGETIAGCG